MEVGVPPGRELQQPAFRERLMGPNTLLGKPLEASSPWSHFDWGGAGRWGGGGWGQVGPLGTPSVLTLPQGIPKTSLRAEGCWSATLKSGFTVRALGNQCSRAATRSQECVWLLSENEKRRMSRETSGSLWQRESWTRGQFQHEEEGTGLRSILDWNR